MFVWYLSRWSMLCLSGNTITICNNLNLTICKKLTLFPLDRLLGVLTQSVVLRKVHNNNKLSVLRLALPSGILLPNFVCVQILHTRNLSCYKFKLNSYTNAVSSVQKSPACSGWVYILVSYWSKIKIKHVPIFSSDSLVDTISYDMYCNAFLMWEGTKKKINMCAPDGCVFVKLDNILTIPDDIVMYYAVYNALNETSELYLWCMFLFACYIIK